MKSTSDSERQLRDELALMHRRIGMHTMGSTFAEAVAFVAGYDAGRPERFLDAFQAWLGERWPGRSELAFPGLVELEAFGQTIQAQDMDERHEQAAVNKLFELLDAYLAQTS